MIRRSPAESYIKYLIVRPDGYDDTNIRGLLNHQQLDFIGLPYLGRLRSICIPPTPFFPEDVRHIPSQRFIKRERIQTIFHPDDAMVGANAILGNSRAKEITETMLISRTHPGWIAAALLRQAGLRVESDAIKRYKHYYFNLDLLDMTELRALLEVRGTSDATTDPDEQKLAIAKVTASKSDARRLSANMATSPLASIMNVLRAGFIPADVEISKIAGATRLVATIGAMEGALLGHATKSRDLALVAKMMTEIIEQTGDASGDLEREMQKLMLATEDGAVPHIRELGESTHTIDMLPANVGEVDAK